MAIKHRLRVTPLDPDKPPIRTYGGVDLTIGGASEQTILLSWQEMLSWGILPIQYPYPSNNSANRVSSSEETPEDKEETQNAVDIGVQEAQDMNNVEEGEEYMRVKEDCKKLKEKLVKEF